MPAANTSCDPVPVPVVNEYEGVQSDVERIARQLHAQHQDEPVWGKLDGHKRDDYHLFAARVLQCPSVAAAFEAQAKLEAERKQHAVEFGSALDHIRCLLADEDDVFAEMTARSFLGRFEEDGE